MAAPMVGTNPQLWVCLQRGKINPVPSLSGNQVAISSLVLSSLEAGHRSVLLLTLYLTFIRAERKPQSKAPVEESQALPLTFRGSREQWYSSCPKDTQGLLLLTPDPKLQLQTCKLYRG